MNFFNIPVYLENEQEPIVISEEIKEQDGKKQEPEPKGNAVPMEEEQPPAPPSDDVEIDQAPASPPEQVPEEQKESNKKQDVQEQETPIRKRGRR